MTSEFERRARYQERRMIELQEEDDLTAPPQVSLKGENLTPAAEEARRILSLALIASPGRRPVAVFLGHEDYQKVETIVDELEGALMLECLPAFVHQQGGQIVMAFRFGNAGEVLNAIWRAVTVNGATRRYVAEGYLFIHSPHEKMVVSAELIPVQGRKKFRITLRGSGDSASFWRNWQDYTRRNNYLRGQAFFADGEIIERRRIYGWDDILLPEETKRIIRTHVDGFLRNRMWLKAVGVKARRGLIFSGPPGTGKTLTGKVLADTLDASFVWVCPRHVQFAVCFQEIMSVARLVSPAVVFLEDLDLFAEEREHNSGSGLGELMNQLDGAIDNEDIITIATTNRLDVIEKALRNRPGRFDRVIEFSAMDEYCRRRMLEKLLAHATLAPADMAHLVAVTSDYTGAQLEELTNTLYILGADSDDTPVAQVEDGREASPRNISVDRRLIDTALQEVNVETRSRLGFHAA